jgi:hypothetical protein
MKILNRENKVVVQGNRLLLFKKGSLSGPKSDERIHPRVE